MQVPYRKWHQISENLVDQSGDKSLSNISGEQHISIWWNPPLCPFWWSRFQSGDYWINLVNDGSIWWIPKLNQSGYNSSIVFSGGQYISIWLRTIRSESGDWKYDSIWWNILMVQIWRKCLERFRVKNGKNFLAFEDVILVSYLFF